MSQNRVDHIAIAVRDLEPGRCVWGLFGKVEAREIVEEQGVEVQIILMNGTRIELLKPLSDDTPVGRFIAKRGEGLHHIAICVPDIEIAISDCIEAGLDMLDKIPKKGAEGRQIAFIHPRSTGGVLVELTSENNQ